MQSGDKKLEKPLLSVALITYNEERIIEKTLSAIHNWVDQIVVIDSFSTDNTVNLLEMFNINLFQEKWQGYAKQKNLAISKCTGDWILVLDADEVVSNDLKDEILKVINKSNGFEAYKIKRKFYLGKRWIRYGGYYPDYQLRLFKSKLNLRFNERDVHESIVLDGPVGFLDNALDHYAYEDIRNYKKVLRKYAKLASNEIKNKSSYLPPLKAYWAFFYRYVFRLGFLEGKTGYELAKGYSSYVYEKYALAAKRGKKSLI